MSGTTLGREQLFHRILVFFAVITAMTGIINLAASGSIDIGSISSAFSGTELPEGSISGQIMAGTTSGGSYFEGANTANGTVSTGIDFTTAAVINQNITTTLGGTWTLENGVGLALTSLPWFPGTLNPSAVIARNVQSSDGIYTVNVLIDNSVGGSFYVFPRYISGYSGSDLKVVFASDGIHIKKFPLYLGILDTGDDYYYPLSNAQETIAGGSTITTYLTEAVSSDISNTPEYSAQLTVLKDNNLLFTTNVRSILPGNNINDQVRHGGVGSDTVNFIVKGFPNTNMLDTSETIVSGSVQYSNILGSEVNPLAAIAQFLALIATFMGLSSSAIIPIWMWAIVGAPCLATLSFMYLEMLRGN